MLPALLDDAASVRRLELMTRRIVNNVMAGEYHSVFKGQGMDFNEVREYQPGDDVRMIDWNVTARAGVPHVKRYVEQRELTVMFAVDVSGSLEFGSVARRKRPLAAIVTAILAFSAIRNNDRVGLMLFSDEVELYLKPRKGRSSGMRVINELVREPVRRGTNIPLALQALNRLQRRKSVVFLLSDFQQPDIRKALAVTNSRHDLVAISISDARENEMPDVGIIELENRETGDVVEVDTSSARVRRELARRFAERRGELKKLFRSLRIDHIELGTSEDFTKPLVNFFETRAARLGQ